MKAEAQYRLVYHQNGVLDHVSEIVLDEAEAYGNLAVSRALHVITGWETETCTCGVGFVAFKDGVRRSEHVEPVDEVETIALILGVLAPASVDSRLEVVV